MTAEDIQDARDRLMRGVDPQIVAELAGFKSVKELKNAIGEARDMGDVGKLKDKDDQIMALYIREKSDAAIADAVRCHPSAIYLWRKKRGLRAHGKKPKAERPKTEKKPKITLENIIIEKPDPSLEETEKKHQIPEHLIGKPNGTTAYFDFLKAGQPGQEPTIEKTELAVPELKDSGARRQFSTGSVRDISEGKGRADLLPLAVAGILLERPVLCYIEDYVWNGNVQSLYTALKIHLGTNTNELAAGMLDVALQYEAGCKKYGNRNWQLGQNLHCYIDSGVRHFLKHLRGDTDEPHGRAFVWNILGAIWTHMNKPELVDLPFKEAK